MQDLLARTMAWVIRFMSNNKLKFNGLKTHWMQMTTKRKMKPCELVLKFEGQEIERSTVERLLGIQLSSNMKFVEHMTTVVLPGMQQRLKGLRTLVNKLPSEQL